MVDGIVPSAGQRHGACVCQRDLGAGHLFDKAQIDQKRAPGAKKAFIQQGLQVLQRLSQCVVAPGMDGHIIAHYLQPADVGRILRTFKIKKNVEVTDNGKDNF